jgi:ABC-type multidrug transport system permease subunit
MIQRIQTIWLLLATLTICCLLFLPMAALTIENKEYFVVSSGVYQKIGDVTTLLKGATPLLISTIVVALISFINIFNFKNRTMQKRIIMVNIILIMGLSFWCSQLAKEIPGGLEKANYSAGMFLPVVAILFCILAMRGIANDEKLLKSADRLR